MNSSYSSEEMSTIIFSNVCNWNSQLIKRSQDRYCQKEKGPKILLKISRKDNLWQLLSCNPVHMNIRRVIPVA